MLFNNLLAEKGNLLAPSFNQLFEMAQSNQVHSGDLLLVSTNGFYKPEIKKCSMRPYSIGTDSEGHSEYLHINFINTYMQEAKKEITYATYLDDIRWSKEKSKEIEQLINEEEFSVQIEMLCYLKIWEADSFIKKFYQLVRLINGKPYDWHFKIKESNRDKSATGTRQDIISKHIKNLFEHQVPVLHDAFEMAYKTQIRNSIAHSQYSFQQRNIHLNNYVETDVYAQIKVLNFNEWVNMFHITVMIHILYSRLNDKINLHYAELANRSSNACIEVIINRHDPSKCQQIAYLKHVKDYDWAWCEE